MGDGALTQDEIDALLQGADNFSAGPTPDFGETPADEKKSGLGASEQDAVSENMLEALKRSSGSITAYVNNDVVYSHSSTETRELSAVKTEFATGWVSFQSQLGGEISGESNILIPAKDAVKIAASLHVQEDTGGSELNGAQEQALKEMMSPMLTAFFVNVSHKSGINFSSGPIKIVQLKSGDELALADPGRYVKITFNMNIAGLVNTRIIALLSLAMVKKIAERTMSSGKPASIAGATAITASAEERSKVQVESVEFQDLQPTGSSASQPNLNLLLDIKMDLTVELGRTRKYVKEILSLGEGSIIELDKLAGEPVDLLVNNKLIARGEVVVIDENFGVRVTDIVKPEDRLRSIKQK